VFYHKKIHKVFDALHYGSKKEPPNNIQEANFENVSSEITFQNAFVLSKQRQKYPFSSWSQCFSRSYASILPTSLSPFIPLTRASKARIPDAVIGTAKQKIVREAVKKPYQRSQEHPHREARMHLTPYLKSIFYVFECGSQTGLSEE